MSAAAHYGLSYVTDLDVEFTATLEQSPAKGGAAIGKAAGDTATIHLEERL